MSYKHFQNRACEYFPCHKGAEEENFNCLFCFCPLYALGEQCGGSFTYTDSGIKDCSRCLKPHRAENYDKIMAQMPAVMALAKKEST
jgi:Zn-finger protein